MLSIAQRIAALPPAPTKREAGGVLRCDWCRQERLLVDYYDFDYDCCRYCRMSIGGSKAIKNSVQYRQMKSNINKWKYAPARAGFPAQRSGHKGQE